MNWIDEMVIGLIVTYSTTDVYEICDSLGITINRVNKDYPFLFGKNAMYEKTEDGEETICVKNGLYKNSERFAIAHELGHAMLHSELLDLSFSCPNTGKIDREANYFAFKLHNIDIDKYQISHLTSEQLAYVIDLNPELLDVLMNSEEVL